MIIILLIVVELGLLTFLGVLWRHDRAGVKPVFVPTGMDVYVAEVVTVHLTDQSTLQGALVEHLPSGLLLKGVSYLDAENPISLSGETFIPTNRINFVQARTA